VVATNTEELLPLPEAAERLGVSIYTVRRWIKDGKLRAFRPGKEYRVREADLEEFLAAREVRPKEVPSPSQRSLFNGFEEERRTAAYQRAWRDFITRQAERIDAEANEKGYEPAWILEISQIPRDITQTLFDNGVLGNREAYPTEAEYRGSWEIADALTELEHAVDRAWRTQMRVSERMERQREAAAELDSIWKRSKEASRSSKEALEAFRQERSESA